MADKKISALTGAATPLAGTEVLPIVQSGSTVKVSVANLTAGRAVSGDSFAATNGGYSATVASGNVGYGATSGSTNYSFYIDAATGSYRLYSSFGGDRWSVDSSGNITVGQGNLVIGTAGKGIDFSANTHAAGMTSELLNDYEEGTFTPVIAGSSSAGTASYVAQAGSYTKIGRMVYFQVYLSWSSGTGTGDLYVSGLPFLSSALPFGVASTAYQLNIALSASSYSTGGYVLSSSTSVRLMQSTVAGGGVSSIPYDAAGEFMMSGSYFV